MILFIFRIATNRNAYDMMQIFKIVKGNEEWKGGWEESRELRHISNDDK